MPDLSPQSFFEVSKQIIQDESMAKKYRSHKHIDSPVRDNEKPCDGMCRKELFCWTIAGDYGEFQNCMDKDKWDIFANSRSAIPILEHFFDNAWFQHV